ncbi:MAG: PKD domain-containing protein [Methanospirillum sp.]|nr:PKD domain-containing protein [Methanospirillum sp.]
MGNIHNYLKFFILCLVVTGLFCVQVSAITADARIGPLKGTAPLNVMFTDASVGKPIEWHWDFGDGYTGEGPRTMHTYMTPGTYTVTLLVLDAQGGSDTATFHQAISVTANPFMPVMPMSLPSFSADFTGGPQSGPAPLAVSFADLSKGEPKTWVWDFGDGTTSIDQNPVHIYSTPGTYTVTLKIAKDSSTGMKERKHYISVTQGTGIPDQQMVSSSSTSSSTEGEPGQSMSTPENAPSEYAFMVEPTPEEGYSCQSDLSLVTESETIRSGEDFMITVNGNPLEKVYFWISMKEGNTSEEMNPPVILDNEMVFDKPEGPFSIGQYVPDKNTGASITELIVDNESVYATGLYGLVALDKNGEHVIMIQAKETSPGVYIANAITGEPGKEGGCISQLQVTILP